MFIHTYIYVYTCVCMYIYIYICVCVCVYIYVCIYIYIYIYIHDIYVCVCVILYACETAQVHDFKSLSLLLSSSFQLMSWIGVSGMRTGIRAEGLSPLVRSSERSVTR